MNRWEQHILELVGGEWNARTDVQSEIGTWLEIKGSKYDTHNPRSLSCEWAWNVRICGCDRYILVGDWRERTRRGFKDCYRYFDVPSQEMHRFLATHRTGRVRCVPEDLSMESDLWFRARPRYEDWRTNGTEFVLKHEVQQDELRKRYRLDQVTRLPTQPVA